MTIEINIKEKLTTKLKPTYLTVENESHLHSVPKGSETHFKIEVVSTFFEEKKLLDRHRIVNEIIVEEIAKIKACSLHAFTPEEWETRKHEQHSSPKCVGGSKTN